MTGQWPFEQQNILDEIILNVYVTVTFERNTLRILTLLALYNKYLNSMDY